MQLININEADWCDVGNSIALCQLPFSVALAKNKFGIVFFPYAEEGLGELFGAYIKIGISQYFLKSLNPQVGIKDGITAFIPSTSESPTEMLEAVFSCFRLCKSDLLWVRDDLSPPAWRLYRVDDNGNEVEMYKFLDESNALALKHHYEIKGHKQSYFVQKIKA